MIDLAGNIVRLARFIHIGYSVQCVVIGMMSNDTHQYYGAVHKDSAKDTQTFLGGGLRLSRDSAWPWDPSTLPVTSSLLSFYLTNLIFVCRSRWAVL